MFLGVRAVAREDALPRASPLRSQRLGVHAAQRLHLLGGELAEAGRSGAWAEGGEVRGEGGGGGPTALAIWRDPLSIKHRKKISLSGGIPHFDFATGLLCISCSRKVLDMMLYINLDQTLIWWHQQAIRHSSILFTLFQWGCC